MPLSTIISILDLITSYFLAGVIFVTFYFMIIIIETLQNPLIILELMKNHVTLERLLGSKGEINETFNNSFLALCLWPVLFIVWIIAVYFKAGVIAILNKFLSLSIDAIRQEKLTNKKLDS